MRLGLLPALALGACKRDVELVVAVHENPGNPLSARVDVTPSHDVDAWVIYGAAGEDARTTPQQHVTQGETEEILVLGLAPDALHDLTVAASLGTSDEVFFGSTFEVLTSPLPSGTPAPIATTFGTPSFDPEELVCTNGQAGTTGLYYCFDRAGTVRFMLEHPQGHAMFVVQPRPGGGFLATISQESEVAFFDAAGSFTHTVRADDFAGQTAYDHDKLDGHEAIWISEGPWAGAVAALTETEERIQGTDVEAQGVIVFEPDTLEVLWDWSLHGQPGDRESIDPDLVPYDRVGLLVDFEDWSHANALVHRVRSGSQSFWMSLRGQDLIIAIDVESGEILWRFGREGDFTMVDDLDAADPAVLGNHWWMYQQHAPEILETNGDRVRFLVYDNGRSRIGPDGSFWEGDSYSRVMEYELDEATMRAAVQFSFGSDDRDDDDHFYASSHGDADMKPSGDGILLSREGDDSWLAEIAYPEGGFVWRARLQGQNDVYRVGFAPSPYDMDWWYEIER